VRRVVFDPRWGAAQPAEIAGFFVSQIFICRPTPPAVQNSTTFYKIVSLLPRL
jgi:hypothetical protein